MLWSKVFKNIDLWLNFVLRGLLDDERPGGFAGLFSITTSIVRG